jgi:DNA-binding MarR family transcriptional regulator
MAARLVQRRQDQALAELGLTHAAVIALQGLLDGPLNQEQLASDIKVRSQSIGRVLSRLQAAGLVVRESSSLDRRHNEVSITEAGRKALEAARRAEQEALPPDVVGGTVLGRELARVISYFPGGAKAGSAMPQDSSAGGEPGARENVDGGDAAEEGPAVAGVPLEGAAPESVQQDSGTDTSREPALQAPVAADGVAAQDAMRAEQDHAGDIPEPNGKGDSAPV